MKSIKPRKQRKELFNAPQHKKRKWMSAHLAESLLLKYDKRSIPVIKGDTVKVMRGSFREHEDKVAKVNVKKQTIEIEGIIMTKADGKKIAKPIHPSTVLITKLNLTDKWRRGKLERGLSEETKKEIETEAAQQLREAEEKMAKAQEEEQEGEELEDAQESVMKEEPKKPESKQETPVKPEAAVKKAPPKKATSTKKTTTKKVQKPATSKKTTTSTKKKATTKKTSIKKEGEGKNE